jgi:ABC-2 type transport system permease protein
MTRALISKAVRELRGSTAGWSLGIGALLVLTVSLYPLIADTYATLTDQLPPGMLAFMGMDLPFNTLEGYLSAEFFSYGGLAVGVFATLAGTAMVASEESAGTLDLLLSWPVSRTRLLLTKVAGLAIAMAVLTVVVTASALGTAYAVGVDGAWGRTALGFVLLWPFGMAVGLVALAASLLLPGRLVAGSAVSLYLLASYVIDSLANLVEELEPLRPVLITSYLQGQAALAGEPSWIYVAGSVGIALAALAWAVWLFNRRDIGVRRASLPGVRALLRRR